MQTVLILTLVLFLYFQFKEDICLISESFLIVPQSQTKYKLSLWAAQIVWISWMYWCTAIDTVLSSTAHCGAQQKWRWNEKCVILWNIILQNQDLLEWTPKIKFTSEKRKAVPLTTYSSAQALFIFSKDQTLQGNLLTKRITMLIWSLREQPVERRPVYLLKGANKKTVLRQWKFDLSFETVRSEMPSKIAYCVTCSDTWNAL